MTSRLRSMLPKLFYPLAAFSLTVAFSGRSLACSCTCLGPTGIKAAVTNRFKKADPIIFVGKVLEDVVETKTVTLAPGHTFPVINHRVRFEVEEAFKGIETSIVVSNNGDGNCSYGEMEVGKSYLVYGYRPQPDSPIFIGGCCNHTRPLILDSRFSNAEKRDAIKEIELLRKLRIHAKQARLD